MDILLDGALCGAIVLGPAIAYIPQYVSMLRTRISPRGGSLGEAEEEGRGEGVTNDGSHVSRAASSIASLGPAVAEGKVGSGSTESAQDGGPSRMSSRPLINHAHTKEEPLATSPNEALSPMLSFILVTSNALRVLYWALERFELSLLLQSAVIIVMQVALIELIVRKRREFVSAMSPTLRVRADGAYDDIFWYGLASVGLVFAFTVATLLGVFYVVMTARFARSSPNWSSLMPLSVAVGYMALMLEATVCMPQMVRNWRVPETACAGLRWELAACWFLGDAIKTGVVWARSAPMPFIVSGLVQTAVDVVIIAQLVRYRMVHGRGRSRVVYVVDDTVAAAGRASRLASRGASCAASHASSTESAAEAKRMAGEFPAPHTETLVAAGSMPREDPNSAGPRSGGI